MRGPVVACLLGLLPFAEGCQLARQIAHNVHFEDVLFRSVEHRRREIKNEAREVLKEVCHRHPKRIFTDDFSKGFIDGYFDFMEYGAPARPPAEPPGVYRTPKYLTPEGLCQVRDWFQGFQYGASCAESTGHRAYYTVPILVTPTGPLPTLNINTLPAYPEEGLPADPATPSTGLPTPTPIPPGTATPPVPNGTPTPATPNAVTPKLDTPKMTVPNAAPAKDPLPQPMPSAIPQPMPRSDVPKVTPMNPTPLPVNPLPVNPLPQPRPDLPSVSPSIPPKAELPKVDLPAKPPQSSSIFVPIPTLPLQPVPNPVLPATPPPIPLIPTLPTVSLSYTPPDAIAPALVAVPASRTP